MSELAQVRARLSQLIQSINADGRMVASDAESDELDYLEIRLAVLDVDDDPPWLPGMQEKCICDTIGRATRLASARWQLSGRAWHVALGRSLAGAGLAHAAREVVAARHRHEVG